MKKEYQNNIVVNLFRVDKDVLINNEIRVGTTNHYKSNPFYKPVDLFNNK